MLVTSGPTHEPIDPVRYIANRSSGKQGHAIAPRPRRAGADVTLVSGPVNAARSARRARRAGRDRARDARGRVAAALPADVAIFAAAVADWRVASAGREQDQEAGRRARRSSRWSRIPTSWRPSRSRKPSRPRLVIGFAAETENVIEHAKAKLARKGCDWIVANDVSPADRRDGRRPQHRASGHRATASNPGRRNRRTRWRARSSPASPRRSRGASRGEQRSSVARSMRLPHGADLPLPAYQSDAAAGLDLRGRGAGRCAGDDRAGRARA